MLIARQALSGRAGGDCLSLATGYFFSVSIGIAFFASRMVCACRFQCTLCIADNVVSNVGDIAGVGADIFVSFAEATCAALFPVASSPQLMTSWKALMYPVLISSLGIVVGIVTPILRNFIYPLHKDLDGSA